MTAGHAHDWRRMAFLLIDGHPFVTRTCATCGAERRIRAWERFWTPSGAGTDGRGAARPGRAEG